MHIFFADDATQANPSRLGTGSLIGTGGIFVVGEQVASLERSLAFVCKQFGFPPGEEFKWSPRSNSWMYNSLTGQDRQDFFLWVIRTSADHGAKCTVMISDETSNTPVSCASHAEFVTSMLIERVNWLARSKNTTAIIVADRLGGGTKAEKVFLSQCLQVIQQGTGYVLPRNIAMNTVSTDSRLVRLLQAADVIVSCVTSFVAGENTYSPPIFAAVRPLLASEWGRTGGIGLKLHPDFRYVNLYHWLLGDTHYLRGTGGAPLPIRGRRYSTGPNTP